MNRNIQNIINKYNTYSKDSLIKLINKNNHIKKEINHRDNLLRKSSLFDVLLKSISFGYGGFFIWCDDKEPFVYINKIYNQCKYKHLYKINQHKNKTQVYMDESLVLVDINVLIVNIQNF